MLSQQLRYERTGLWVASLNYNHIFFQSTSALSERNKLQGPEPSKQGACPVASVAKGLVPRLQHVAGAGESQNKASLQSTGVKNMAQQIICDGHFWKV